jgi:hypothetical protein
MQASKAIRTAKASGALDPGYTVERFLGELRGLYRTLTPEDHQLAARMAVADALDAGKSHIYILKDFSTGPNSYGGSDLYMLRLLKSVAPRDLRIRLIDSRPAQLSKLTRDALVLVLDDAVYSGEQKGRLLRSAAPHLPAGTMVVASFAGMSRFGAAAIHAEMAANPHVHFRLHAARRIPSTKELLSRSAALVLDTVLQQVKLSDSSVIREFDHWFATRTPWKLPDYLSYRTLLTEIKQSNDEWPALFHPGADKIRAYPERIGGHETRSTRTLR